MPEKACRECRLLSVGSTCSKCKTATLSEDYSGLVIIFDPENSLVAKAMKIKEKGRYASRVR